MGEEYVETRPFFFFTSFDDKNLATAVSEGRKRELGAHYQEGEFADPQDQDTFERSKLDWPKVKSSSHAEIICLYRDLVGLRREHPSLGNCRKDLTEIQFEESKFLVIKRGDPSGELALIVCNFSDLWQTIPVTFEATGWKAILWTGDPAYGRSAKNSSVERPRLGSDRRISVGPFEAAVYISKQSSPKM
jgi:maltooligosyltrehalose trehalohydrolase